LIKSSKQTTRIGVYGIVRRSDEILLCRLSKQVRFSAGLWTLPGGGLEFGEHPEQTLVREIEEETGLLTKPCGLAGINNVTREISGELYQSIQIIYFVKHLREELLNEELRFETDGTTDKCEWLKLSALESEKCVGLVSAALKIAKIGES